ncbi:MAG: hypothetical protein AAFS10_12035 [Myxococcota bacterium]
MRTTQNHRCIQLSPTPTGCLLLIVGVLLGWTTMVHAQAGPPTLSVVGMEFTEMVPEAVKKAVLAETQAAVINHKLGLRYRSWPETRQKLTDKSPALAGCTSEDCLKRSGEILQSPIGLSAAIGGEAQIYDFQIIIHNLQTGEEMARESGSCDICTPQEAGQSIGRAISKALDQVTLPEQPTAKTIEPPPQPVAGPKVNVDVVVVPESARLTLGDRPLGEGTATTRLSPGTYTLKADAEGFESLALPLTVAPEQKGPMMLRLYMAPTSAGAGSSGDTTVYVERNPGLIDGINPTGVGWTALAVGVVSTVVGGVLLSIDGDTTCSEGPTNACPNVYDTGAGGAALVGVGTVGITSGLFLIFWDQLAGESTAEP